MYKIGQNVKFYYGEGMRKIYGKIFKIRKFPKIYFIETNSFVYKVKEKQIIGLGSDNNEMS